MLSLSQSVGYAIQALSCMEATKCSHSKFVREIAACSNIPPAYLAKIFAKLVQAGILQSKRGLAGGTSLARRPEDINLLEICNVIDGEGWNQCCLLGLADCTDERNCPTHAFWKATRKRITDELAGISLADMFEFEARKANAAAAHASKAPRKLTKAKSINSPSRNST
jgi:Rrf2 family transcriptional regulator, iron-sulfur cluster assembly transcription factor